MPRKKTRSRRSRQNKNTSLGSEGKLPPTAKKAREKDLLSQMSAKYSPTASLAAGCGLDSPVVPPLNMAVPALSTSLQASTPWPPWHELSSRHRPENDTSDFFRGSILFGFLLSRRMAIATAVDKIPALKLPLLRLCRNLAGMAYEGLLPAKPLSALLLLPSLRQRLLAGINSNGYAGLLDQVLNGIIKAPELSHEEREGILSSIIYLKFDQDGLINPSENPFWEALLRQSAQVLMTHFPLSQLFQAAGYQTTATLPAEHLYNSPFYYRFLIKAALQKIELACTAPQAQSLPRDWIYAGDLPQKIACLAQELRRANRPRAWKILKAIREDGTKPWSMLQQNLSWREEEHFRRSLEDALTRAPAQEQDVLQAARLSLFLFPVYENPVMLWLCLQEAWRMCSS